MLICKYSVPLFRRRRRVPMRSSVALDSKTFSDRLAIRATNNSEFTLPNNEK